jgi:hypothetical protein
MAMCLGLEFREVKNVELTVTGSRVATFTELSWAEAATQPNRLTIDRDTQAKDFGIS